MRTKILFGIVATISLAACKTESKPANKELEPTQPEVVVYDAGVGSAKIPKLVRSKPLSTEARIALRRKMLNHGDDMENLLWSTLMLDYESSAEIAAIMAKSPTLARAGVGQEDTINAFLPDEFFVLQDQQTSAITELRSAALARHDGAIAEAYSKVAATCIQCHSLYLRFPTDHLE